MKKLSIFAAAAGFIIITTGIVLAVSYIGDHYLIPDRKSAQTAAKDCQTKGVSHLVVISDGTASPKHTTGSLCDSLTIKNEDNQVRLMAFGPHDAHQSYDGLIEKQLAQGQSLSVTFSKTGTYQFHDHIGDVAHGDFTVIK